MAINGKTKATVDALLTSDTTTETQFKTGLLDITSEIDGITSTVNTAISNLQTNLANSLSTGSIVLGSWSIYDSGGYLYFMYNGNNVFRIDSSGNIVAEGNVTAYQGV
jgi:hypothetical protein